MSWIESHQSLLTHRKLIRAASILRVSKYELIGHLHTLWWWGLDNAENDGSLGETFPEEIAEAAGWPSKKAKAFVDALVSVHFLDETERGYRLHNWWNYAGKLNAKRAKDRARKAGDSSGIPAEVARKSQAPTNQHQPAATDVAANQPNQPTSTNQPSAEQVLRERPNIFRLYEQLFGKPMSPLIAERLKEYEAAHDPECVEHCFREAAESNARNVKLVYAILDRHATEGCYATKPQTQSAGNSRGVAEAGGLTDTERAQLGRLGVGAPREYVLD